MDALYKGNTVKVTKIVTTTNEFIKKPILIQVRIEWKKDGQTYSDYVDANEIKFID